MVQQYVIAGRKIGSHYLAMGVLGLLFGGSYAAMSGPSKKAAQSPPINASSSDEESYIKNFLAQADKDEKASAAPKH